MSEAIRMDHYKPLDEGELQRMIANPPIRPCGNFILIRAEDVRETYGQSGIVIAEKVVDREQKGVGMGYVVALGAGAYSDMEEGPWCQPGDRVVFQRYEGVVPPIEGMDTGKLRLISDNKVLGVL